MESFIPFDFDLSQSNALCSSSLYTAVPDMQSIEANLNDNAFDFSSWINEDLAKCSSPIPIPDCTSVPQTLPLFHPYVEQDTFLQNMSFLPSHFARPQPEFVDVTFPPLLSDTMWVSQLWDSPSHSDSRSLSSFPFHPLTKETL